MRPSVVSNVSNHSSPNRSSPKRSSPGRKDKPTSDANEHELASKEIHVLRKELETVIEEAVDVAEESSICRDKDNQNAINIKVDSKTDSANEDSKVDVTEGKENCGINCARSSVSALLIAAAKSDSMDLDDAGDKKSKGGNSQVKTKEMKGKAVTAADNSNGEERSGEMMDRRSPAEAMEGRLSPNEDGNRRESASEGTSAQVSLRRSPHPPSLSGMMNVSSAGPLKKRRKIEGNLFDSTEANLGHSESFGCVPHRDEENDCAKMSRSSGNAAVKFHFPNMLHRLLSLNTNNEIDNQIGKAMEWLPHGNGWRVLRWDVMCAHVLPRHFGELLEDFEGHDSAKPSKVEGFNELDANKTKSKFSHEQWIDAFLSQLKAWGFEKVRSGIDMGSYRHEVRKFMWSYSTALIV